MMTPDQLRASAAKISRAAGLFGVAGDEIVKVSRPGGAEVPMRLDELLQRMERKAKKMDGETRRCTIP
jgi:hypothetical protein